MLYCRMKATKRGCSGKMDPRGCSSTNTAPLAIINCRMRMIRETMVVPCSTLDTCSLPSGSIRLRPDVKRLIQQKLLQTGARTTIPTRRTLLTWASTYSKPLSVRMFCSKSFTMSKVKVLKCRMCDAIALNFGESVNQITIGVSVDPLRFEPLALDCGPAPTYI